MTRIVAKQFRRDTKTMKEALHDTIHNAAIPPKVLAEELGMTLSYLYRAATDDPDTEGDRATGVRFPLKQLAPLIRLTADYQVLDVLEYQLGRVAVALPVCDERTKKDIQTDALKAVVAFGDFVKEVQSSMNDGKICEKEQKRIDKEGREAIQAILALMSL